MAELLLKAANMTCQLGCYSERGLMSYFMFVELPSKLRGVLTELEFPNGVVNPFLLMQKIGTESVVYSELCFGNEGFGSPDGAVFVDCEQPAMIFIEAKANETYVESCRQGKKKHNSTIQRQLELRWRLCAALRSGGLRTYGRDVYIQETAELKLMFGDDCFYEAEHRKNADFLGAWRRLKVIKGVAEFVKNLQLCEDRVYFCAITDERSNPFNCIPATLRPRIECSDWERAKRSFCWLPWERIRKAGLVEQEAVR